MIERVTFVSCVKQKSTSATQAKSLYISDFFLKMRKYAESREHPWYILSAKHGLVHPESIIEPYEKTLTKMAAQDQRAWAYDVLAQIQEELPDLSHATFLAGNDYRRHLVPKLSELGVHIEIPMDGLRIGFQKQWLKAKLRSE